VFRYEWADELIVHSDRRSYEHQSAHFLTQNKGQQQFNERA